MLDDRILAIRDICRQIWLYDEVVRDNKYDNNLLKEAKFVQK